MNQKRIKGFTLIELLAVIVILAIIALIAVPVIMNIINQANKSAFKNTAYGVIQAGELYFAEKQLEPNGMSGDVTIDLPDTTKQLVLKGEVPKGTITITEDGKISITVTNGRYCAKKGLEERDVTITEDVENCTPGGSEGSNPEDTTELTLGSPIYFHPVENRICDGNTEYAPGNSATGFKDGCMKWYVYKIDGDNLGLILDHNTTATVPYNDDTTSIETPEQGLQMLDTQLDADTVNWKVEADIIDARDILNLLPWYQNLEDKINWESQYKSDIDSAISTTGIKIQTNAANYTTALEMIKAMTNMLMTDYSDIALPKYLHEDLYSNCANDGNCTIYGYWTKTVVTLTTNALWQVTPAPRLDYYDVSSLSDAYGIRPVITISK